MNNPRSFFAALSRASRSLRRRPGFFFIAVSSLAIALGLATTVIAQIDSLMHPYTPMRDAPRLFSVMLEGTGVRERPSTDDVVKGLRESDLFEQVAITHSSAAQITIGSGALAVDMRLANRDYQDLVGMQPQLGRLFAPGESRESGVALVSETFWKRYFGNALTLDGAQFEIDKQPFRVVGVLEKSWERGTGSVWLPRSAIPENPQSPTRAVLVGRMKADVDPDHAREVMHAISERWVGVYGAGRPRFRFLMHTLEPDPLNLRQFHIAMIAAALFILIIASSNVSALTLARGVANRRSQALRLALGARRSDLLRDITAEVTILAGIGGIAGIAIAYAATAIMIAATPAEMSWLGFARPNFSPRVFIGLFAATAVCITLAAIGPAWYLTRIAPAEPLKDGAASTTGRSATHFRWLVVGELALSMVLLFGASLIAKTAHKVTTFDFGYEARNLARISPTVIFVSHDPNLPGLMRRARPEVSANDLEGMVARLRALPDVRGAAWYATDAAQRNIVVSEATVVLDSMLYNPTMLNVGDGFLGTLGIPVIEGRDFAPGDRGGRGAVILDERSARRLFPDGSPIGRLVKLGEFTSALPWLPVVGVARNALHALPALPELEAPSVVYVSRQHSRGMFPEFVIRSARGAPDILPVALRTVRDQLPPGSTAYPGRWSERYDELRAGRQFTAGIFGALSIASLVLATAGLFGVLSYAVNQRMREFSLRIALGARGRHMLRLVLRDGLVMALGGTAIGAFSGLYAGFSVYEWLWGVYPVDATALIVAEVVLLVVTLAASAIPAMRATRANPADVLRST